ncbi:MAG: hypothetical protein ACE5NM_09995 [Sedimentisphaerales bacterium]
MSIDVRLSNPAASVSKQTGGGYGQNSQEILETTGVRGGLVVHVNCGNGRLTAALHANERISSWFGY